MHPPNSQLISLSDGQDMGYEDQKRIKERKKKEKELGDKKGKPKE